MRTAVARRNEALTSIIDNLNSGYVRLYSGTRPTDADTALSGNTLLAQGTFSSTAFAAPSGGSAVANAITGGTASNTGTATFARLFQSDGTTAWADLSVGTSGSGAEIILSSTSIVSGVAVAFPSMQLTLPVGA